MHANKCFRVSVFLYILSISIFSLPAYAGWDVTVLSTGAYPGAVGRGVSGNQQVGVNVDHAALWSGTAGSFVDLNPEGCYTSEALGVSNGQQTGSVEVGESRNFWHAALWSGSAASFVDLNPAGYLISHATGISGTQQVGLVQGGPDGWLSHAALWNGTADSFIDLNPDAYYRSTAYGTDYDQQVGYVQGDASQPLEDADGYGHAALWNGTADSFVDLHPDGYLGSAAYGVSEGQQVGMVSEDGYNLSSCAALWNGTANSFVNLNPVGCNYSIGQGICDGWQVGDAWMQGSMHAASWQGTADSFMDLHDLLSTDYDWNWSSALGVWKSGEDVWIVGAAGYYGNTSSVMWHYTPVPEPSGLITLLCGVLGMGGIVRRRRR